MFKRLPSNMRLVLYLILFLSFYTKALAKEFIYEPGKTIVTSISKKYNWLFLDGLQIKAIISPDENIRIENISNGVLLTTKARIGKYHNISLITSLSDHIDLKVQTLEIEPQFIHIKVPLQNNYLRPKQDDEAKTISTLISSILDEKVQFEPIKKTKSVFLAGLILKKEGYFQKGKYKVEIWNAKNRTKKHLRIPTVAQINKLLHRDYLVATCTTSEIQPKSSSAILLISKRYD